MVLQPPGAGQTPKTTDVQPNPKPPSAKPPSGNCPKKTCNNFGCSLVSSRGSDASRHDFGQTRRPGASKSLMESLMLARRVVGKSYAGPNSLMQVVCGPDAGAKSHIKVLCALRVHKTFIRLFEPASALHATCIRLFGPT